MDRNDFMKLIGAESAKASYLPVALLLRSGYACAGYYHTEVNDDLASTCVLLNAQLIDLHQTSGSTAIPTIQDFNDFLEEIVVDFCGSVDGQAARRRSEVYGKSIPLTAIPFDEIAVIYPVAHIGVLMQRAEQQERGLPTFLDFQKSELVNLLRTRLW